MDLGISGKRALVTGASRGLGRSIASCLAREGAKITAVARNKDDLDSLLHELGAGHDGLVYDLMKEGAPSKMYRELRELAGEPEIIIHNVGGTLDITDPLCGLDAWRKVYRFNLEIAIELNLLALPFMQARKWGRIVHISSIASLENQGTVPYCSIKAALNAYTRSLGRYVSPYGINISAVLPGAVFTKGGYWDYTSQNRPDHFERYRKERMAIQRFGEPDEIGNVVAFLCSNYASFIVGSSILVDGGQGRVFQNEEL
jgi:NAD(P)-dependent dehydrogenase (short-subunit alcohol dehydrogenase family)